MLLAYQGELACTATAAALPLALNSTHTAYLPANAGITDDAYTGHTLVVASVLAGRCRCWKEAGAPPDQQPRQTCSTTEIELEPLALHRPPSKLPLSPFRFLFSSTSCLRVNRPLHVHATSTTRMSPRRSSVRARAHGSASWLLPALLPHQSPLNMPCADVLVPLPRTLDVPPVLLACLDAALVNACVLVLVACTLLQHSCCTPAAARQAPARAAARLIVQCWPRH